MTFDLITFVLEVGIGSTIALDLSGLITAKIGWMPGTHWPSVGRWLLGIPAGRLVLDGGDDRAHSVGEVLTGWVFHYAIGIAYAVMFPLFWGVDFISAPTVFPFVLIGVIISTLAGLIIFMPGMGGGIFARKLPNAGAMITYVLVAHVVFAIAQYVLALLVA